MNDAETISSYAVVVIGLGGAATTYSLEETARIARVHPDRLRHYCRLGLFGPDTATPDREPIFNDDRLYEVRRFEHYRQSHGANAKTLRLLCALWSEVERLKAELQFHRGRTRS